MKNFAMTGVSGFVAPRHLKAIHDTGNRLVAAADPHDAVGILDQYSFDVRFFTEIERFDRHLEKLRRGLMRTGARSIIIGGGVSANRGLRAAMENSDVPVLFPPMEYCTDNAAMSAGLAYVLHGRGLTSALDLDAITYSQFRA